ncbi:OLC1v1016873C1 [Oldenlandia corymbosa var. corymbosa]|uniref:Receptor-like serine/threonine-protein kinase n=1 Tax=Oldenlandia corymbosa var. corymbosa TaxID=529605 RepID=A0AAV1E854_OLDCO|nr:OLC1v1016873C1 [Oldenlandia corymbosa var. corymbosa]
MLHSSMASLPVIFVSMFIFSLPILPSSSSAMITSLAKGSSLSIQDFLVSTPNPTFTAGFFSIGENAYCFSIWFTQPNDDGNHTVVWMANRDQPVNGKGSRFSLQKSGNLVLTDAGKFQVWTSNTKTESDSSSSSVDLQLQEDGNLVLRDSKNQNLWQSFDSPTDTLLPGQIFTGNSPLISKRSLTNYSSGFYKLYFDTDNILRQMYQGPEITSIFWPDPWLNSKDAGRSTDNNSKTAVLDFLGHFHSSDEFKFNVVDYGPGIQRRFTIDFDGSLRVYSLVNTSRSWKVSWQAKLLPCNNHGICGLNSLCTYDHETGRKCSCAPGYRRVNQSDWSYGCEPEFQLPCDDFNASGWLELKQTEYYGYDVGFFPNYTFEQCKELCLKYCDCKGFQFKYDVGNGYYDCFPKTLLFNGYTSIGFPDPMYLRLPKSNLSSFSPNLSQRVSDLKCSAQIITLDRQYGKKHHPGWVKTFLWCTLAVGAIEIICLLSYLYTTRIRSRARVQGYLQVGTGFRKFSYAELKKATKNFSEIIGRGGSGDVYKGVLPDNRVAAVKCLDQANYHTEAVFLTEVSTIGRLNHMNLIELWGYCAEGKHRLLVYEHMEHGSLAKNLQSDKLDWKKRYDIALGTAKGLAYLHEECLEWVLHCDVKPENILLDSNYHPKVADFGLSKLLNRGGGDQISSFSRIRGTRGYMAPEWVFNLPITSKVDVYSYGIVVLEMVTGKNPVGSYDKEENGSRNVMMEPKRLVQWVKENMHEEGDNNTNNDDEVDGKMYGVLKVLDPRIKEGDEEVDVEKMENLIRVAIQCAEEDRDGRPTMRQVVDLLMHQNSDQ